MSVNTLNALSKTPAELSGLSYLSSGEEYIASLYESYLANPDSVPADWRDYFILINNNFPDISHAKIQQDFLKLSQQKINIHPAINASHEHKQSQVKALIQAYRELGHLHANLDPLGLMPKPLVPELELDYYRLNSPQDLASSFSTGYLGRNESQPLSELLAELKQTYCNTIGAEYGHIFNQNEVHWLENRLEQPDAQKIPDEKTQHRILACLTAADGLEKYLGTKYAGQKRFSLEGGDSLIVLLDTLIQSAGNQNIEEIVIGMAHRGRLNVLVNILGKSPQELFDAFEGKNQDNQHSGDVKYHLGFSSDVNTAKSPVHLALAFNPSHLEIVSPVVTGSVRARQERRNFKNPESILGIQIHGDAAFAGQGVVMETFSLSQTQGFTTAGTIHIIINNQIGFTTDPVNTRSTYYCTDIAKMVQAPIFHVNADDPEAVLFITQLALDYRMTFGKDVVIDLVCYRRHGHNEADEPSATQPVMYRKIKTQPVTRKIYADKLIADKKISADFAQQLVEDYRNALDKAENFLVPACHGTRHTSVDWTPYLNQPLAEKIKSRLDINTLKKLAEQINTVPAGMTLQPQVAKVIEDNRKMGRGEIPVNWGFAENLAYAALLTNTTEEINIRISGQDVGRGTFAHRHAVWHDYETGQIYTPLKQLCPDRASSFNIIDSILSEEAVLAFEYGYSGSSPQTLVIWEAQFGDFANGAQVVMDQFISSGEQKWNRLSGLTLLLPHGYEGMGPEHSSARLERYLQLCAQENMQVCVPTTPAQIFHLLRRQMLRKARKPLIVITPKSLLRHKLAVSTLEELASGDFQCVISETSAELLENKENKENKKMTRVIFCTGKVYYDLLEYKKLKNISDTVLIRIEQLYPFPDKIIGNIVNKLYLHAKKIIWCQEEPQNQGAWFYIKPPLDNCLDKTQRLTYAGRKPAASTAAGSAKLHQQEQQQLVIDAFA